MGCSPWGREESDTTECLHFYFSLSCIGEGNGNPLQCSCLENPRVGGAWWAAVCGVGQSQTRLKRLSTSSRSSILVDMKRYLNVVCISLTITLSIIHVFIDHLYILLEKCLFKFFIVFLIGSFVFLLLSCKSSFENKSLVRYTVL